MWFQKKNVDEQKTHPTAVDGFALGQIVRHKVDGVRVVIIGFDADEYGPIAFCARSSKAGDESDFHLAEIEAIPVPATE